MLTPNKVTIITFNWFEAGQKLVRSRSKYFSSIPVKLLLQDRQRVFCAFFGSNYFAHDIHTLIYYTGCIFLVFVHVDLTFDQVSLTSLFRSSEQIVAE